MSGAPMDFDGDGFREINVIPLVDVMLVLLIVFMVAAPMLESDLEVDLPDANVAATTSDRETVSISINAREVVSLEEREITGDVGSALAELRTREKPVDLAIRADKDTRYEAVAAVVAAAQANSLRVTLVVDIVGP